jgi:hypothetical protein
MSKEKSTIVKKTPKYFAGRNALTEKLRPIYDRLVEDYAVYTFRRYGSGYVAYRVLADLVDAGWRKNRKTTPRRSASKTPIRS